VRDAIGSARSREPDKLIYVDSRRFLGVFPAACSKAIGRKFSRRLVRRQKMPASRWCGNRWLLLLARRVATPSAQWANAHLASQPRAGADACCRRPGQRPIDIVGGWRRRHEWDRHSAARWSERVGSAAIGNLVASIPFSSWDDGKLRRRSKCDRVASKKSLRHFIAPWPASACWTLAGEGLGSGRRLADEPEAECCRCQSMKNDEADQAAR